MGPTKPSGRDAGMADGLDPAAEPLELRMLGPLEAWRGAQRLVLGGQRQRSVLACLMLDPGRDVSADRIIDAIWGERPPSGVLTTLQTYVFHLREVIEPSRGKGAPARVVVTVPGGYRLDTAHATLDAERFETLVGSGRAALSDDPQRAATVLADALAMWRGDVLSDLASLNGVAAPATSRLTELRVSATETWVAAELALGHHDTVLPTLDDLVEQHPLREHLAAIQMLALYRAGRQSDALQAYRRLRHTLDEELGIQPSVEVETMQERVLRQDPSLILAPTTPVVTEAQPGGEAEPTTGSTSAETVASGPRRRRSVAGLSRRAVAAIVAVVLVAGLALVASVLILRRGGVTPLPGNSVGPIDAAGLRGDPVPLDERAVCAGQRGRSSVGGARERRRRGQDRPEEPHRAHDGAACRRLSAGRRIERRRLVGGRVRGRGSDPRQHAERHRHGEDPGGDRAVGGRRGPGRRLGRQQRRQHRPARRSRHGESGPGDPGGRRPRRAGPRRIDPVGRERTCRDPDAGRHPYPRAGSCGHPGRPGPGLARRHPDRRLGGQ